MKYQLSIIHLLVPGAGVEPARIAPLVFETSASTDSAIRALLFTAEKACKGTTNIPTVQI